MSNKHISMRGEVVDMERLRTAHGAQPALGNAKVNARGDKLGDGGIVLKTQEQIEHEWALAKAKADKANAVVDIKGPNRVADALAKLAPKPKAALASDDAGFDPTPSTDSTAAKSTGSAAVRRKVTDAD